MITRRFRQTTVVLIGAAILALTMSASAQAAELVKPDGFPKRSITMIIPFGAGGGSDQMARALGAQMAKIMGVGIRYSNKSGAGGLAALPDFAVAPADGYTILQHPDAIVTGQAAAKHTLKIGEDLLPLCIAQLDFSQLFIRSNDDRFSDWESLVAYAKETGKTLTVATSSGQGSHEHTMITLASSGAGIKLEVVPFGDPGQRVSAILGGHVAIYYDQPGETRAYVEGGKLKPVLSIHKERPEQFDDVPALPDVGLNFEPTYKFRGLWIRTGMPEDRHKYLSEVCKQAWETDAFQAFLKKTYTHIISRYHNTEEALKLIQTMLETYEEIFKELGIVK